MKTKRIYKMGEVKEVLELVDRLSSANKLFLAYKIIRLLKPDDLLKIKKLINDILIKE